MTFAFRLALALRMAACHRYAATCSTEGNRDKRPENMGEQMSDTAPVPPFLARVRKGSLCTGCGGCAALSDGLSMERSSLGYQRPVVNTVVTARQNAAIAAICPGLGQNVEAGPRQNDVIFGPFVEMREGWASAPDLRFAASSGGALSAVLVHLLDAGVVDGIVHVVADPEDPVANTVVISRTAEDVRAAAGSRYAPSSPLAGLADLPDGRFAVVGKPCDAAALQAMRAADPTLAARVPVVLSFFCAGVPSIEGGRDVVRALGVDPDAVSAFRYRGMGWPGRATATGPDGAEASMTYAESWGQLLSPRVQHRCRICADGTGVAADLVCADAWETDDAGYPLFEEDDGVSLIVARTDVGRDLMSAAQTSGHLVTRPFDLTTLPRMQRGQTWRRRGLLPRLLALQMMGRPVPRYRGLGLVAVMRLSSWRERISTFAGMARRAFRGRGNELR